MRKILAVLGILLLALYILSWLLGKRRRARLPLRALLLRGLAILAGILVLQGILQTLLGIWRGE